MVELDSSIDKLFISDPNMLRLIKTIKNTLASVQEESDANIARSIAQYDTQFVAGDDAPVAGANNRNRERNVEQRIEQNLALNKGVNTPIE